MTSLSIYAKLIDEISRWTRELGFQQVGISDTDLKSEETGLQRWLDNHYHGSMSWMAEHKDLRAHPEKLVPGTTRVITVRMDYLPAETQQIKILKSSDKAYISRYALGRDYHKLIRKRLAQVALKIENFCTAHQLSEPLTQRAFVDSAPVLERPLAQRAGLGWVGKHTLLINQHAGSWFFLGELFTNLPLPVSDKHHADLCGDCQACLQVCPTDAFPAPYVLDARRCISYLTIENKGPIPEEFREVIGNRVFGCDDCQAICPWNKYAHHTQEKAFHPRHGLDNRNILDLFLWSENEFLDRTSGSPIRRIGYQNWLRNLSVALGNAPTSADIIHELEAKIDQRSESWLIEHFRWSLQRQKMPPKYRKRKLKRPTRRK